VAYLTWAENIAEKVSEEEKVKIIHWIPGANESPLMKFSHFRAEIDTGGLNGEEKMKLIDAHVRAVNKAYDLAMDEEKQEAFIEKFVENIKLGKQPRDRA